LPIARLVRRGRIEGVITFKPLGIVRDLMATLEAFLGLRAGGKNKTGACESEYGAHGCPYTEANCRLGQIPCKYQERRSEPITALDQQWSD
jgi:hypothetical protein